MLYSSLNQNAQQTGRYRDCPHLTDPVTGRRMKAQVFVAVLPYSGLIFAQATPDQRMASWLEAHRNMLEWFEGVPNMLVPDQCATAVDRTPRGLMETRVNRQYLEFAGHYGTAVVPARGFKPRDKALVEEAVNLVEQWIVEPSRDETFRTIMDLNDYIGERVMWLNRRHATPGRDSRQERFEAGERQMLLPLPAEPFSPCQWRKAKVPANYHIRVEHMNYSVPHELAGRTLDVKLTAERVVAYDDGIEVASHSRLHGVYGQYSTWPGHMPENHRNMKSPWNRERFESWAEAIGPETRVMVTRLLDSAPAVEQAYVPCNNILNLSKKYGPELLEQAAGEINQEDRTASLTGMRHRILAIRDRRRQQASPASAAPTSERIVDRAGGAGRVRGADAYRRTKGGEGR